MAEAKGQGGWTGPAEVERKLGVSPAQVLLNWQWRLGIPTNPRSQNSSHNFF